MLYIKHWYLIAQNKLNTNRIVVNMTRAAILHFNFQYMFSVSLHYIKVKLNERDYLLCLKALPETLPSAKV